VLFDFAWHRLVLDAELGETGALEIETFTAAHVLEPERIARLPEQRWSRRIVLTPRNRQEVLIQSAPGRYLWLRIGLVGGGTQSPRLRGIDILGPRRSSLRFLPAPFHEDPVSRDFLDRFLSYFDTVFDETSHRIGRFSAELSPQGAPEGRYLAWLISWFDIELLAGWSEATRRAFLANAMKLHRARGTVAGLRAVLRLHLGVAPPIPVLIESFRLRRYLERRETDAAELPDGSLRIGGVRLTDPALDHDLAHRFYVVVPDTVASSDEARAAVRGLVDRFRPAHTAWELITVAPGVRVGCQSTVGVDTLVGGYPASPVGEMALGGSAQINTEHSNVTRVGAARLGLSPNL
jgi:phage tail-like protein